MRLLQAFLAAGLLALTAGAGAAALDFSSLHGGNGHDEITALVVLNDDSVLMTGWTDSTDLPTPGGQQTTKAAGADGFLVKINAANQRVYGRYINGAGDEYPLALAVDGAGKIYVAGLQVNTAGDSNCMVIRFAANGAFESSWIFGGAGEDRCTAIAVESGGRIHVAGYTNSTDFPVTSNAWQKTAGGGYDGFYAVIETDGTRSYTTYLGAANDQKAHGIAVAGGYAYITGGTSATPTPQAFVLRINTNSTFPEVGEWSKGIGGSGFEEGLAIALDASGNVFVTGTTTSNDLATTAGVFGPTRPAGDPSCFVARLAASDGSVQKLSYGQPWVTECNSLALRGNDVWIGGLYAFLPYGMRTDPNFAAVGVSAVLQPIAIPGGSEAAGADAIGERSNGHAVLAGYTRFNTFITTSDAFQAGAAGVDGFVTEIDARTPNLSLSDCSLAEGAAGSHLRCEVTATLDAMAVGPVDFRWYTSDGTALAGSDYQSAGAQARIDPARTSVKLPVVFNGDALYEADESGAVTLVETSGPVNFADTQATFTLVNDDAAPSLSVSDCAQTEGGGACTFDVTLSAASGQDVTFNYTTASGSAIDGSDFTGASGSVTIPAGNTLASLAIATLEDNVHEGDESFALTVSGVQRATVARATGVGTIGDNDPAPTLTVDFGGCSANETSGGASCDFVFRLSNPSATAVTFTTATAGGSAVSGIDFATDTGTPRTIPAGQLAVTVPIAVLDDNVDEPNETFTLNATGVAGASPASLSATGTIVDDDPTPTLSVDNGGCTITETNGTTSCTFVFRLSRPSNFDVSFTTATRDGTATANSDYSPHSATVRTFPRGLLTYNVVIPIIGDTVAEGDENYFVDATNVTYANPSSLAATGTIHDDDAPPTPTLSIDNGGCTVTESTGGVACNFVFRLSTTTSSAVTFTTSTANGTAGSADYTGHAATTRSIPAGQTSITIAVPVLDDALDEPAESFTLNATNIANATPASLSATGTINDNDPQPSLAVDPCTVAEGNSGTTNCAFRIKLSAPSGQTVTANWAPTFGDLPAIYEPFDTPSVSTVTTIGSGQTLGAWTVDSGSIDLIPASFWSGMDGGQSIDLSGGAAGTIHADVPVAANQAYRVHFALAGNAGCGSAVKRMEVRWNGALLGTYSFDTTGHGNANMGWRTFEVAAPAVAATTARLSFVSLEPSACGPALDEITVLRSGFAGPGDLPFSTGSVSFAPGVTVSALQTIAVNGDTQVEPDETFAIIVYGGANYRPGASGVVTIVNDDAATDAIFASGFE